MGKFTVIPENTFSAKQCLDRFCSDGYHICHPRMK